MDRGISAGAVLKPQWAKLLGSAKPGDEILILHLDLIASSLSSLLLELALVERLDLSFHAIGDDLTAEPGGAFYSHMRALSGFHRKAALARSASQPTSASPDLPPRRAGGHVPQISEAQWQEYKRMMAPPLKTPVAQIARLAGVSRAAIYKRLKKDG